METSIESSTDESSRMAFVTDDAVHSGNFRREAAENSGSESGHTSPMYSSARSPDLTAGPSTLALAKTDEKLPESDVRNPSISIEEVVISLLRGFQAIPIRAKIVLDQILNSLPDDHFSTLLRICEWTREDYIRGYIMKNPDGSPISVWRTVDESLAMDRLSSFPFCSPILDGLRAGFFPPWIPMQMNMTPMPSLASLPCRISTVPSPASSAARSERLEPDQPELEEPVNVVDSPSPAPTDATHALSIASNEESPSSEQKLKKRVHCELCKKSFCDKGALKIHTSAVHLKEMHTCTVPGCGKEFSSRRSRNRHASNSNPKLHMPEGTPFRDQLGSMQMPGSSMTSPLYSQPQSSSSSSDPSPSSHPVTPRSILGKRRADDLPDQRPLDLSWRNSTDVGPPNAKNPFPFPTADLQLMLLQHIVQAQASSTLGNMINNRS